MAVPLVKQKHIVYEARPEDAPKGLPHPIYIFSVVAAIAIALTVFDWRRKKLSMWFDAIIFSITGVIGILLAFLWFATDHKASYNFNLLWALPTHIVAVIAFVRQPAWLKKYFLICGIIAISTLILWGVLPQKLNLSLIPIVIMMAVRSLTQYQLRRVA
jgi:hypothetical protein